MHCGDHILFWWAIGLGLWPVHGFCAPSLGGGGRGRRNSPLIQIVMLRIILLIQGSGGSAETDDPTP